MAAEIGTSHVPASPAPPQVLFLAAKDVKSSKALQLVIAVVNAVQLWIFPLRLITKVSAAGDMVTLAACFSSASTPLHHRRPAEVYHCTA